MTGDTHYDLEILAELAEGLLDDATARRVREHLAVCDPCGESLADLAAVREVLAAVPVPAMPLGVAMRIDRALAAEASRDLDHVGDAGEQGLRVVENPDWGRIMRDAPWETAAPKEEDAPAAATLGVVADDGTVVPVVPRRRRRPWRIPAVAAAAAAVVIGGTGVATTVLSAQGGSTPAVEYVGSDGSPSAGTPALAYTVSESKYNYTSRELNGPLLSYFGAGPASDTVDDAPLDKCVKRFSDQLDRKPIGVDKAFYNGNEATIMAFWEDKNINAVRVVVVDSSCKSLRPESLATWK
ncbi:anti-sigma factor family protein [Microtetraspora niveoalba]|uniref:anti-sigma factor family protein n=1 Tax=Microtetraspora niveoalba TaxID=46175 RepID=UPI00082D2D95|nr:zf-HC2 domain-containing protein [Microtetraspora niveoalba]